MISLEAETAAEQRLTEDLQRAMNMIDEDEDDE